MKKIKVVIFALLFLSFCSCSKAINEEKNVSPDKTEERLDNILYDVLKNTFDYYHSLSLLNLEEIAANLSLMETEADIAYIVGQIDIAEDYGTLYSYFTFRDQAFASRIVCPEELEEIIGTFLNAKHKFLLNVKYDLEGRKAFAHNSDFKTDCEALASLLRDLHINSDSLKDADMMREYDASLNDAVDIMSRWISL